MRYGMISIAKGGVNLGNRLIEWGVKNLLRLPEPSISVTAFSVPGEEQIRILNQMDFIIIPGSTTLALGPGQGEALDCLEYIKVPVYCVGGSGWGPKFGLNVKALNYITPPIGARDPWTHKMCLANGFNSVLVGCPTMHTRVLDVTQPQLPFTVIGFARENHEWQTRLFKEIEGHKVASIQEPGPEAHLANNAQDKFDYAFPENVLINYARCGLVVTGRLHGVLPAISQRKPVAFFGDPNDTRFSLLEHIGVYINPIGGRTDLKVSKREDYEEKTLELRKNFYSWIERTVAR